VTTAPLEGGSGGLADPHPTSPEC